MGSRSQVLRLQWSFGGGGLATLQQSVFDLAPVEAEIGYQRSVGIYRIGITYTSSSHY